MKLFQFLFFLLSSLGLLLAASAQAQPKLEQLWITEGLQVPESVLFYGEGRRGFLLVSQIDGEPNTADGKGGIAKMTQKGELVAADWVTGLNAPKGMAAFADNLYVADINEIVVINIKKATIEKKIPIVGAIFLNDVVIDSQGVVYVSDTRTNKVYRIQNEVVDTYLDKVESANGLAFMSANLVVGAGKNLLLFDKQKNRLPMAAGFAQAVDGVVTVGRSGLIVSCWAGLIYFVGLDGHLEVLLDSQEEKINNADIGYDPASQVVFVPNFFKNTVTAYQLTLDK